MVDFLYRGFTYEIRSTYITTSGEVRTVTNSFNRVNASLVRRFNCWTLFVGLASAYLSAVEQAELVEALRRAAC